MEITAGMVRDLREKTGLPMMECKKALTESGGDFDGAVAWLKKNASVKMEKMSSREASQGRVAAFITDDGQRAGLALMQCETAPVAENVEFINLTNAIAQRAASLDNPSVDTILDEPGFDDPSKTLGAIKDDVFSRIRENMVLKSVASLTGHVASYVHHNAQTGVIVAFSGDCPQQLRDDICMHITAMPDKPLLSRDDVDPEALAEERERIEADAKGKPPEIAEKIIQGKLNRWYGEYVLHEQAFVKDDKQTVGQVLDAASKGLAVTGFERFAVGA